MLHFVWQVLFVQHFFRASLEAACYVNVTFFHKCIYINSYLEVAKFSAPPFMSVHTVNIFSACAVMCFVRLSLSLSFFLMVLLSPFVFVMSVAVSHSSTPALKAVILSPSLTVCLMFGP